MKKSLAVMFALVLFAAPAAAKDLASGIIELSGSTSFTYNSMDLDPDGGDSLDATITTLGVDATYYILPNIGVGGLLSYANLELEDDEMSATMIGPQARYNFSLSEEASVFGLVALGYSTVDIGDEDVSGWFWKIGGGLKYFLNSSASVDGVIAYTSQTLENDVDMDITGFSVGGGFSLYF